MHSVVKMYTADYDKTLIFNKVHHELNQVIKTLCMYATHIHVHADTELFCIHPSSPSQPEFHLGGGGGGAKGV